MANSIKYTANDLIKKGNICYYRAAELYRKIGKLTDKAQKLSLRNKATKIYAKGFYLYKEGQILLATARQLQKRPKINHKRTITR
jgi:hypothetical protein